MVEHVYLIENRDLPLKVGGDVGKETLLAQARRLLPAQECYLVEQRARGRAWSDLAEELGTRPEALRRQVSRVLDRLLEQIHPPSLG